MDENSLCLHKDACCTNEETISKYQKNGSDQVGISTPVTSRDLVMGLPKALYNSLWMSELNEQHKESLKISGEKFPWMKVVVA